MVRAMDEHAPTPCRTPPPDAAEAWALEVAAAIEALEQEALSVRLDDGSLLEPDDDLEAVVLLAVRARGCALILEDVTQACADLANLEREAELGADENYGDSLHGITWRYLLAHTTLGVIDELPDPALVEAVIEQAGGFTGGS